MIKVLLADDNESMRTAMRRLLSQDPRIKIIGEADSFASTMQAIADFKPEVLLLDLHLPESRNFSPEFVRSQLGCVPCTLAVSFSKDSEAKSLAESYGASTLLDKMKLYNDMIPAILDYANMCHARSRNISADKTVYD
jgi:chemotaxis response regulator CheB